MTGQTSAAAELAVTELFKALRVAVEALQLADEDGERLVLSLLSGAEETLGYVRRA